MEIINREYQMVPTATLQKHPRNPRQGDIDLISESIAENGFFGACIAQRATGFILVGIIDGRWHTG